MNSVLYHLFVHKEALFIEFLVLTYMSNKEKLNVNICHIVETRLNLMAHSSTPSKFWHYAFDTTVYLINRLPTPNNRGNLIIIDFRSRPCVFLGYSLSHHRYRCFDKLSGCIYIARHVRLDEKQFPFSNESILVPPPSSSFLHLLGFLIQLSYLCLPF